MKKNVEKQNLINKSVEILTMHFERNIKDGMNKEEDVHNAKVTVYHKLMDAFSKMTIEENEMLAGILCMMQVDIDFDRATKSKMFQK